MNTNNRVRGRTMFFTIKSLITLNTHTNHNEINSTNILQRVQIIPD